MLDILLLLYERIQGLVSLPISFRDGIYNYKNKLSSGHIKLGFIPFLFLISFSYDSVQFRLLC